VPGLDGGALVRPVLQHAKTLSETDRNAMITALRERAGELNLPSWEGPMSWSELRTLTREGHEVGSHSMSHSVLREDLCADQHREVAESRRVLEKNVRAPITSFCFPTGEYDDVTMREVHAAGYQNAVTTHPGQNSGDANPFELRRFDIQGGLNANRRGEAHAPVLAWRLSRLPGAQG
jgi:peptidoglycan/xylan/chitin deacetylase (PgdA/CDA1 family)